MQSSKAITTIQTNLVAIDRFLTNPPLLFTKTLIPYRK